MKVRATMMGYYGEKRRREGDVFVLKPFKYWAKETDPKTKKITKKEILVSPDEQFSDYWMERVEGPAKAQEPSSVRKFGPNIGPARKESRVARGVNEPSVEEDESSTGDRDVI